MYTIEVWLDVKGSGQLVFSSEFESKKDVDAILWQNRYVWDLPDSLSSNESPFIVNVTDGVGDILYVD